MDCSKSGLSISRHLTKLVHIHVRCISDAIQPFHPLMPSSPSLNLSQHQGFSSELAVRIRWPKYWSFSFSLNLSNDYSELISLKIDWFDLLFVQETFSSLLQQHSSKVSILWCSALFMAQHSQVYMPIVLVYTDLCWQNNVSAFQHTV